MGYRPIFCFCEEDLELVGVNCSASNLGEDCGVITMDSILESLEKLFEPAVSGLGCEFWGVQFNVGGKRAVLRVFIEKESGVELDDCERVSRHLSSLLDVENIIRSEYVLEVSSPGFDRQLFKLDHFERNIGAKVVVKLRTPFDGRRKFTGLLTAVEGEDIVLRIDEEEYLLPYPLVDKANVVPQY